MRVLCLRSWLYRALQWSSFRMLLLMEGGVYPNDQRPHNSLYELQTV